MYDTYSATLTSTGSRRSAHSAPVSETQEEAPAALLAVLKAVPSCTIRNNLAAAWRRLSPGSGFPSECASDHPLESHQWLPGQWTPVLYGLSRDWRHYARSVLTHTLTVDLAIAVSLQRPDGLDSFLSNFPSLQNLTVLAGNGGAPVDDSPRTLPSPGGGPTDASPSGQMALAIADPRSVAHAVAQLLRLDHAPAPPTQTAPATSTSSSTAIPAPDSALNFSAQPHVGLRLSALSSSSTTSGVGPAPPKLHSLELKCHPAVWSALGSTPDALLTRVVAAHPALETFALHVWSGTHSPAAHPLPTVGGSGGAAGGSGSGMVGPQHDHVGAVRVNLQPLAALAGLARLQLGGPLLLEGLEGLTQLQALAMDGVCQAGLSGCMPRLGALTTLLSSDGRMGADLRIFTATPVAKVVPMQGPPHPCRAASLLPSLRALGPRGTLRVLRLPDVVVGPAEWGVLQALCPGLLELELAAAVPHKHQQHRLGQRPLPAPVAAAPPPQPAGPAAGGQQKSTQPAAAAPKKSALPDWFLRATSVDGRSTSSGGAAAARDAVREAAAAAQDVPVPGVSPLGRPWGTSDSESSSLDDSDNGAAASGTAASAAAGMSRLAVAGPGVSSRTGMGVAAATAIANAASAGGCPFAASLRATGNAGGGSSGGAGSPRAASSSPGISTTAAAAAAVVGSPLPGVRKIILRQHVPARHLVALLELLPDLRELQACLAMADPSHMPAAALRAAATADLSPLTAALQPLTTARLDVSCDPAAVTGQLAGVFLRDCGLGLAPSLQGMAMAVWVAAETQMVALAAMKQLRSLDLTLGKQDHESELTALTQLTRLTYLSLRVVPGSWNDTNGRTSRITAGAALRLAMSFAVGQVLLLVADVHREVCEDEAISLVKSVEMAVGQPGSGWPVSAWVEETAECVVGYGMGGGTIGGGGAPGAPPLPAAETVVLRVVWTPELVRRLLAVVAGVEVGGRGLGPSVSFMSLEEERLGRVLGS